MQVIAPASAKFAVATGFLSALAAAFLARPSLPIRLSFSQALATAVVWSVATALSGTLGLIVTQSFPQRRLSWPPRPTLIEALPAWLLLPPLLLCWLHNSAWALALAAAAAATLALCLRSVSADSPDALVDPEPHLPGPHFARLPPPDSGRPQALAIAVCVETALLLLNRGALFLATLLIALGSFLLAAKRLASLNAKPGKGTAKPAARAALAVLAALFFLVPFLLAHFPHPGTIETRAHAASRPQDRGTPDAAAGAYQGIILFAVPDKKKQLPPLPIHRDPLRTGLAKPLVIPFDGSYWYFQAPHHDPGTHPHFAHGDPVAVTIYSTGWVPLAMQAHQTLQRTVDLRLCSSMRVSIRNGDNRPGRIDVGVLLSDSTLQGKPSIMLDPQPIVSTEESRFTFKVSPIDEDLTFPIPVHSGLRKFDEITVLFFPGEERSTLGARVGIRQFELLPR